MLNQKPNKEVLIVDASCLDPHNENGCDEIYDFFKEYIAGLYRYVRTTAKQDEVTQILSKEKPDLLLLLLLRAFAAEVFFKVLSETRAISPSTKVIVVSRYETRWIIEETARLGADNYIILPCDLEYFKGEIIKILGPSDIIHWFGE